MFNLVDELNNYQTFDKTEQNDKTAILEFLKNNNNCFDRSNKMGHITAGALVCDELGFVLLNHHKATNRWIHFGGHSDGCEDCFKVAKREVFEETGIIDFKICEPKIFDVAVHVVPYSKTKNEPEHFHYDVNFLFVAKNHDFKISQESKEIKWVSIEEAEKLVDKNDVMMKRILKKYKSRFKSNKLFD